MPNAAPEQTEVQQDQGAATASQPPLSQPSASAAGEASSLGGIANARFTPGPWERRVNEDNSVIRVEPAARRGRAVVAYATQRTLSQIAAGDLGQDDGTNYANARLIAAAPDLYEALADIVWLCDDPTGGDQDESLALGLVRLLPAARTALARARGEQP